SPDGSDGCSRYDGGRFPAGVRRRSSGSSIAGRAEGAHPDSDRGVRGGASGVGGGAYRGGRGVGEEVVCRSAPPVPIGSTEGCGGVVAAESGRRAGPGRAPALDRVGSRGGEQSSPADRG